MPKPLSLNLLIFLFFLSYQLTGRYSQMKSVIALLHFLYFRFDKGYKMYNITYSVSMKILKKFLIRIINASQELRSTKYCTFKTKHRDVV